MPREMIEGPEPSAAKHASAPATNRHETVDFTAYLTRKHATRHRELLDFRLYLQQRHPPQSS